MKIGSAVNPPKLHVLTDVLLLNNKKEQLFLGIMYYLRTFSQSTAEVCKPLRKLTPTKTEWIGNNTYEQAKSIIVKDASVKFHNENKQLQLETDEQVSD